jgi:prepilin-type N-terminal cleavage/methylation domain-containing protein
LAAGAVSLFATILLAVKATRAAPGGGGGWRWRAKGLPPAQSLPLRAPAVVERRHRQTGFTLLEVLIATAVLLVALLVVADLLDESGRLLHHSARRARDGNAILAGELLKNDLRSAVRPPLFIDEGGLPRAAAFDDWERRALLIPSAEGPVVWRRRGQAVERVAQGTSRALLRGVTSFRWQALRGPTGVAVEVEVERTLAGSWSRHAAPTRAQLDRPRVEHERWLVPIGVTGGGW